MRPRLPRNVVVLSWVSFFQDAASELVYPIMPLFITGTLGAPAAVVGLIEGVAEATPPKPMISARVTTVIALRSRCSGTAGAWPVALAARFV